MNSRKENKICVHFSTSPEGTHFREGTYSWVRKAYALELIESGEGKEYDPLQREFVNDEPPTANSRKYEIVDYLKREGIEHDPSDNKDELVKLLPGEEE